MKKFFMAIMAVALVTLAGACKKSAESADANKEEVAATAAPKAAKLDYTNEKCGYSVTLPEGYKAQNNLPEFEEMGATKLFVCGTLGATIDFCANPCSDAKSDMELAEAFMTIEDGETLIKKEVKGNEAHFQYKDSEGSCIGLYHKVEKGKSLSISFHYPAGKDAEFAADYESVTASFKFN